MKPRFCTSPLGVSDAIEAAWRTYSMIYDKPDEQVRLALETYISTGWSQMESETRTNSP